MMDVAIGAGVGTIGIQRPLVEAPATPLLEETDPDPHGPAHGPFGGHVQ